MMESHSDVLDNYELLIGCRNGDEGERRMAVMVAAMREKRKRGGA